MSVTEIMELLMAPLGKTEGFILVLVGVYSLYFNVNAAKRKNHRSSERAAQVGGWLYVLTGVAIMIIKLL